MVNGACMFVPVEKIFLCVCELVPFISEIRQFLPESEL